MTKWVVMANDHGAIEIKQELRKHLEIRGYTVTDLGTNDPESIDYPDMAETACGEYKTGEYEFGILCCGTGIGISISANKIPGIRCGLPQNSFSAAMAKEHNNCNFIAFGGRVNYPEPVTAILDAFIDRKFEGGRHTLRVDKISALEKKWPSPC